MGQTNTLNTIFTLKKKQQQKQKMLEMLEDYKEKQRKQHKVYYAHLSCTFSIDKSFLWFSVILCLLVQKWESESRSVGSDSLQSHGLYSPWNSPGQNTGADSLSLLQGIFPTQGSNPGPPHYRRILYWDDYKWRLSF